VKWLAIYVLGLSYFAGKAVGERSVCSEGGPEGTVGADRSENAGISSENRVRIPIAACPRFPEQRSSSQG